jgi:transketolase
VEAVKSGHPGAPLGMADAATGLLWTRHVDSEDDVIGLDRFGASAPAERLYAELGITKQAIVARAKALLGEAMLVA